MTEMSTGRPPHYEVEYDEMLAIRICNGLRPEFAEGTPECYIQLASQCMDADPFNRPTAFDVYKKLSSWRYIVGYSAAKDENELAILKAFQFADEVLPTLSTKLPNFSKDKLTSKLHNFKNLSKQINSSEKLQKIYDSGICDFLINDNIILPNEEKN
ncbi:hypothetical protein C2G38_2112262, partial [Gigaspora rosea]